MVSRRYGRRTRRTRIRCRRLAVLTVVIVVLAIAVGRLVPTSSSSMITSPLDLGDRAFRGIHGDPSRERRGPLGEADGVTPDGGVSVWDDVPTVTRLDAELRDALWRAATAAGAEGVELRVESGWRSTAYQERLLQEAVLKYGSQDEAARWVATPATSAHVSGDAVDIGPPDAARWLSEHGAAYGLCQIYANESWHYELRAEAVRHGCPSMYDDPTQDPRMR